jgi:glycosyltransferase involved in cell wall biosynthesis
MRMGGAEKLITELVPLLNGKGHQVDVLLFDGTDTPLRERLEQEGSAEVFDLGDGSIYTPTHILGLVPYIRYYDIVHTHNTACQFYVPLAKLCSRAKVKLVTTEHNTDNRRRGARWFRPIDQWMYRQYEAVIAVSQQTADALSAYMGRADIHVVYNGIDVETFRTALPIRERQAGKTVLTMVAAFRDQKDQDTLLRALALLPEQYSVWLVGDGKRRTLCEQLARELGVSQRVVFWGIRDDVERILKASDIVVMSSHYEGFGLSVVEGMAAGRPVIASDVDGLREVVGGAGLLFAAGNEGELAEVILRLESDEVLSQAVAERCTKRAAEYDIYQMVERYERIYLSVNGTNKR